MINKVAKAGLLVLLFTATLTIPVLAEEDLHIPKFRVSGEVTAIDLDESSFAMQTRDGEDLRFQVIDRTVFRSPDGSLKELGDLEVGMKALVVGVRLPERGLIALVVGAADPDDIPETFRLKGIVNGVDLQTATFSILIEQNESQRLKVVDRTQFRSRDGSVTGLKDLEIGTPVVVVGTKTDESLSIALIVIAGSPDDRLERFDVIGEITSVIPGQNEFQFQTRAGESLLISVGERTRFRSRDGSIKDIHDLKKGMQALVAGVVTEDGAHHALLVAVGKPDDTDRPRLEVRAAGKITSIGDRSFTLETRGQGFLTFVVDENTIFKSRGGEIKGFEDLEIGMFAAVGGQRTDNGQLKALIVGVGQPKDDQAHRPTDGWTDQPRDEGRGDFDTRNDIG